ncbi:MAG: DUF3482 domain-containing protein [Pseudomonadota bacterium]
MNTPRFAVVGRPNKGKSSIVATLARDDAVHIDIRAGSTKEAKSFPMSVDGQTLYELVDTPGLQRARSVLDWLETHCDEAAARPETVRRFVNQHTADVRFQDECQALQPIVEGAGIIYVVDGSVPYGTEYEAEMEILRWSGKPSLALINPIESDEFVEEWTAGLGQYFKTVRVFNAHRAEVVKQLELLELFGHLDPHWRPALERAVAILREDRRLQAESASSHIADFIRGALRYRVEQSVPEGAPLQPVQVLLFERYKSDLSKRERQCRKRVEELYYYGDLTKVEEGFELIEQDLFDLDKWYLWGLSKRALNTVAASAGAVLGGGSGLAVDAASGGLLGGLGTLVAGAGGAISGLWGVRKYADQIAQIKLQGIPTGGTRLAYGPSQNPNFPFVLLGRALRHHRLVCARTHADRSVLTLDEALLEDLTDSDKKRLGKLFDDLRRGRKVDQRQKELHTMVLQSCRTASGVQ